MKSVARVFRLLPAALLACALAVSGAAFAGEVSGDPAPAEPLYVVNPEAVPLSREETLSMAEEAAEAFYNSRELQEELQSEAVFSEEEIPVGGGESERCSVLTLSHGGKTLRCLVNYIEDPED